VDVEFHVRHIALPHPGDWRQLCIQVARIHSRPLDRSKPLWEAYVIEGLDNIPGIPPGSFAFYIKFHHAAIDGEGGTVVLQAIHSLSAEPDEEDGERRTRVRDRDPTQVELYTRALVNTAQRLPRAASFSAKTAARFAGIGAGYMGQLKQMLQEAGLPSAETVKSKLRRPPVTRFSAKVSAHRVVELIGLPMADIKQVRQRIEGATINDVFMTTVGGALNLYLGKKGELPDRTMTAQVPMSLRGADKGSEPGNQIGVAVMPLHTEIADPIERLHAIQGGGVKAKAMVAMVGKDLTKHVYDLLPAVASELFTTKVMVPTMNIVVSNVRGPDVPLYMAGARMVAFAPVSIAMNGLGLNVTGFSYHGTLWICAVACRDMMPDPAFFADCLRSSFARLVEAAEKSHEKHGATQAGATAARPRKAAAKSKAAARGRAARTSRAPAAPKRKASRRRAP
jgi:diacylglycerol O-acyltransferase